VRVTATLSSPPGSTDPAAAAETVVEGDSVGERESVAEGDAFPVGVPDVVPVGVRGGLGEPLPLSDPEPEKLGVLVTVRLGVPLVVGLVVTLDDALAEEVSLVLGDAVPDGVPLADGVATALRVSDCDPEPVRDGDRVNEGDRVSERDLVRLPVLVPLGVPEAVCT
jgi:hypothetical protein